MLFLIIYLIGLVPAVNAALDVSRQTAIGFWRKAGISVPVVLFSWIGYFAYKFVIRYFIVNKGRIGGLPIEVARGWRI